MVIDGSVKWKMKICIRLRVTKREREWERGLAVWAWGFAELIERKFCYLMRKPKLLLLSDKHFPLNLTIVKICSKTKINWRFWLSKPHRLQSIRIFQDWWTVASHSQTTFFFSTDLGYKWRQTKLLSYQLLNWNIHQASGAFLQNT